MIKFTIIWVIVYFVLWFITKMYVSGMNMAERMKFSLGWKYWSKGQRIWFTALGWMRLLSVIFGGVSAILLVLKVF